MTDIYRNNFNDIKYIYDREKDKSDLSYIVSLASISSGVPARIVAGYISEMVEDKEEIERIQSVLNKFYG